MTRAEMETHIVRYGDLQPYNRAFVDALKPGSDQKRNFTISGGGVSKNLVSTIWHSRRGKKTRRNLFAKPRGKRRTYQDQNSGCREHYGQPAKLIADP